MPHSYCAHLGLTCTKVELCKEEKTFWAGMKMEELSYGRKVVLPSHPKHMFSEGKFHGTAGKCDKTNSIPNFPLETMELTH